MDVEQFIVGATGYDDMTTHKDPERKQCYIDRHKKKRKLGSKWG